MEKDLFIGWHKLAIGYLRASSLALVLLMSFVYLPVGALAQAEVTVAQVGSIRAADIVSMTNSLRQSVGVSTLAINTRLQQSAQLKAQDMADKGYFAHADEQGRRLNYWIGSAGYNYTTAGENLAVGFATANGAMNGWKNSPSHYANMVKVEYQEMGVGVATGEYKGEMTTFVVQHFAEPKALILPVSQEVAIEIKPMFEEVSATPVAIPQPAVSQPAPVPTLQPQIAAKPTPVATPFEFNFVEPAMAFNEIAAWQAGSLETVVPVRQEVSSELAVLLAIVTLMAMGGVYMELWGYDQVKLLRKLMASEA